MAAVKMTPTEYQAKHADIQVALAVGLEKELKDCAWQPEPNTDLWDLPTVDSKTVCKLSPIVEAMTGHKLQAKWVRKGGYPSVAEAVADLMVHIAQDCVAPAAVFAAAE
jgi:hypothetical protein